MILLLAAALSSWTVPLPEGYDSTVAPSLVACTSEPTRVHAEMHLTKVHTMDEKKETISIEGYLRLRWNDQRLAATPGTSATPSCQSGTGSGEAVGSREYPSASGMWVPDFYIENALKNDLASEGVFSLNVHLGDAANVTE